MKTESIRIPAFDSSNSISAGRTEKLRIILFGLIFTLFFAAFFAVKPSLLQRIDFINYDLLLKNFPDNYASTRFLIIDIDEKSLNRYGQWPWPRYRVAELFNKIALMEPAVIGLDMIFSEPDRTSAGRLLKDLKDAYELDIKFDRLPDELRDNDLILAESLSKGPFVLGNQFHFNSLQKSSDQCALHPVKTSLLQDSTVQGDSTGIPEGSSVLCNLKVLSERVDASGFCNFSPDPDGMLRRLPLLIGYGGEFYASLALATVLKLQGNDNLLLKKTGKSLQSISYSGTTIPVDAHSRLLIKFRGPKRSYEYISAADIMANRVSSEQLEGRIAFVGSSAAGLRELHTTPFDPTYPGIEAHVTVADNLLSGEFISLPPYSNGLVLLLFILLPGVLLSLLIGFRSGPFSLILTFFLITGLWLATQQVFFRTGLFIGTSFPIASVICNYIFLTILKYRSEYKKEKRALKESEKRFRILFKKAPIPMCHISMDGKILDVNDRLTQSMGYTTHDLPALEHAWHLSFPDPYSRKQKTSEWRPGTESPVKDDSNLESSESRVLCKDGTYRAMIISSRLIGKGIIVSFFDITERKEAEKEKEKLQWQLHQSQKLEAVGILAGGVAHDFNNMLGAIMGYAELEMQEMSSEDPRRNNLDRIMEAAQLSSKLTRQLLAFASKQKIEPIVFDLNEAVENILKMIRKLIQKNIELKWFPGEKPCTVMMDPSQFDQILVNLCINARDAISDFGRITIETDAVYLDESYCSSKAEVMPGNYVLLSVSDNGCGMDKQTLDHIFEPFFTTKDVGKGTGMGLATVYGIVKQNKGFINVNSESGKGTTFKIFIPMNEVKPESLRSEFNDEILRSRGETLLIVDDDPTALEMSVIMLQKLGYSVLAAGTPEDAVRIAEGNKSEIHLLITDVVMPRMNGRALSNRIKELRPKMKYLFMSGYSEELISHQGISDQDIKFIQKPFLLKDIAVKVREILD
ncbi:MAG TPA: CHASE2 domain-containing protein [Desulfobacteraceae bacterium]|nr:CHASE2 domain-containing protein [Desulfobacteraceae bacterium]HPJ66480.1 CHASE2 domain-containing protein [Desulfobacteraceae bacterium]HPQ29625.1 CHASE2 domain-containing protein [Desulfobacteraceae bacterium]